MQCNNYVHYSLDGARIYSLELKTKAYSLPFHVPFLLLIPHPFLGSLPYIQLGDLVKQEQ